MKQAPIIAVSALCLGCVLTILVRADKASAASPRIGGQRASPIHAFPVKGAVPNQVSDGDDDCGQFQKTAESDDANEGQDPEQSRIRRGFAIAPVPLNTQGKNCALVGLGSYLVNTNECVDCHTRQPGQPNWFVTGGSPFLGQPEQINTAHYLWGGGVFNARDAQGNLHPVISRNLTPDASGLPAGYTFEQFRFVIRTGTDLKNLEPHIPSDSQDLLQVMPWPLFDDLTDHDLRAMYEYLRAIPCVEGPPGLPPHPCS